MKDLEYCIECAQPTGNAGEGEDSLYRDDGTGPYCFDCFTEDNDEPHY